VVMYYKNQSVVVMQSSPSDSLSNIARKATASAEFCSDQLVTDHQWWQAALLAWPQAIKHQPQQMLTTTFPANVGSTILSTMDGLRY